MQITKHIKQADYISISNPRTYGYLNDTGGIIYFQYHSGSTSNQHIRPRTQ